VAKVSETLAADEHAIGLKAALDDQRSKAVRLLTVAPPPPQPHPAAPPGPTRSPGATAPPLPGAGAGDKWGEARPPVVVQESAAADLASAQALALLDDLHAKLDGDADLRLSISWRLEKPGAAK
jgi:hypothetical protein